MVIKKRNTVNRNVKLLSLREYLYELQILVLTSFDASALMFAWDTLRFEIVLCPELLVLNKELLWGRLEFKSISPFRESMSFPDEPCILKEASKSLNLHSKRE